MQIDCFMVELVAVDFYSLLFSSTEIIHVAGIFVAFYIIRNRAASF